MKPEPIDQLGAHLFDAARSEAVPRGAEQRALAAVRREIGQKAQPSTRFSVRRKWTFAAACAALAAPALLLLRARETSVGISAEPSTVAQPQPEKRTAPRVAAPSETARAVPDLPALPKLAPSAGPTAVHSAPASLSDELRALKVASSALSAGDPQGALAALDRYDRVLKGQKLRAEATLLKLEALSRTGQAEAASALAQRFVERNPGSPLVDRARSFVHE
ncbi:MAG: hypothetical protein WDO74_11105 [Pseudomonadota bacterium]